MEVIGFKEFVLFCLGGTSNIRTSIISAHIESDSKLRPFVGCKRSSKRHLRLVLDAVKLFQVLELLRLIVVIFEVILVALFYLKVGDFTFRYYREVREAI